MALHSSCEVLHAAVAATSAARCLRRLPRQALAANGATAVDDTDIDPVGTLQGRLLGIVRRRTATASGVVSPGCVFNFGRPVDITFGFARVRADGDWGTGATVKVRTFRIPAEAASSASCSRPPPPTTSPPASSRTSWSTSRRPSRSLENFKLNLNGGWLHNVPTTCIGPPGARASTGASTTGSRSSARRSGCRSTAIRIRPHASDPRAQFALRFKPNENLDFDVIYGRNIIGENAHWITVGMNVAVQRFGERPRRRNAAPLRRPVMQQVAGLQATCPASTPIAGSSRLADGDCHDRLACSAVRDGCSR